VEAKLIRTTQNICLLLSLLCLAACTTMHAVAGETSMNMALNSVNLRQRVDELLSAKSIFSFGQDLTPALPLNWRDGAADALVIFVYRREAEPTSIVSYSVFSPTHKIEISAGKEDWTMSLTALESSEVGTDGTSIGRLEREEILEAEQALVRIFTDMPTDTDSAMVKTVYGRWVEENPALVESLSGDVDDFLRWLE
jgi:hypothetical protein